MARKKYGAEQLFPTFCFLKQQQVSAINFPPSPPQVLSGNINT